MPQAPFFLARRFHEIGLNQRLLAGAIHQAPSLAELENEWAFINLFFLIRGVPISTFDCHPF
jgi:hypothetical protein